MIGSSYLNHSWVIRLQVRERLAEFVHSFLTCFAKRSIYQSIWRGQNSPCVSELNKLNSLLLWEDLEVVPELSWWLHFHLDLHWPKQAFLLVCTAQTKSGHYPYCYTLPDCIGIEPTGQISADYHRPCLPHRKRGSSFSLLSVNSSLNVATFLYTEVREAFWISLQLSCIFISLTLDVLQCASICCIKSKLSSVGILITVI